MKKLIIVIALIISLVSTICSAQTITKKYQKIKGMNFSNPTYLFEIDETDLYSTSKEVYNSKEVGDIADLNLCRYEGKSNLNAQGGIDTNEVKQELIQVQKMYKDTYEQKVKALETTDTDLIRLQGIILYLNQKLESERKKK